MKKMLVLRLVIILVCIGVNCWSSGIRRVSPGISGGNGAFFELKTISEEITIAIAEGNTPAVASSTNLAPANSFIIGIVARVTDAPGGGATTIDIGVTSGDTDGLVDGMATSLNTTATTPADGNSGLLLLLANGSATTMTITTDADVTGNEMKVRIIVYYFLLTPPTS